MNKFPWIYAVLFSTAWAMVGIDLLHGQRTIVGSAAGVWLVTQAIGLALQKLKIGIPERRFWQFWADSRDGGIDHAKRRRWAWFCYEVLSHLFLLQYERGVHGKLVKRRDTGMRCR